MGYRCFQSAADRLDEERSLSIVEKTIKTRLIHLLALKSGERIGSDLLKTFKGNHAKWGGIEWINKNIFFKLPYWRTYLLQHNVDVMHIQKNVCYMIDIKIKTKETLNARLKLGKSFII